MIASFFFFFQLDNELKNSSNGVKNYVQFNDFSIILGYVSFEETDDQLWLDIAGNDIDTITYHLDTDLSPSVYILIKLRDA